MRDYLRDHSLRPGVLDAEFQPVCEVSGDEGWPSDTASPVHYLEGLVRGSPRLQRAAAGGAVQLFPAQAR